MCGRATIRACRRVAPLVFLALASRAEAAAARAREREPQLFVYLSDCVGMRADLLDGMRREVEDIYSRAGTRIVWRSERPVDPAKAYEARAYIIEELPPALRGRMRISKGRAPMAITLGIRPTEPSPDIYVSHQAVLERASRRHPLAAKHEARALGRTLAHELAHRFLKSRHTAAGILKSTLTDRELIDEDASALYFTTEQIRRLRDTAFGAGDRDTHPRSPASS